MIIRRQVNYSITAGGYVYSPEKIREYAKQHKISLKDARTAFEGELDNKVAKGVAARTAERSALKKVDPDVLKNFAKRMKKDQRAQTYNKSVAAEAAKENTGNFIKRSWSKMGKAGKAAVIAAPIAALGTAGGVMYAKIAKKPKNK